MKGKEKVQDSPRKIATLGFTAMTEIWRREEEVCDIQTQSVLWYSEAIQWIHLNLSVHIISWMTPVFQTDFIPPFKGDWHRLHAHEYSIMTIFWIWYGSCKQQILFEYSKLQAQLQMKHFHCWVIRYNKGFWSNLRHVYSTHHSENPFLQNFVTRLFPVYGHLFVLEGETTLLFYQQVIRYAQIMQWQRFRGGGWMYKSGRLHVNGSVTGTFMIIIAV